MFDTINSEINQLLRWCWLVTCADPIPPKRLANEVTLSFDYHHYHCCHHNNRGEDTVRMGTVWGALNVSLPASGTQLGLDLTCVVIFYPSSFNHHPLFIIRYFLSVIRHPSSVNGHQSSVIRHPLSVVRCPLSVIRHMSWNKLDYDEMWQRDRQTPHQHDIYISIDNNSTFLWTLEVNCIDLLMIMYNGECSVKVTNILGKSTQLPQRKICSCLRLLQYFLFMALRQN